MNSFGGFLVLPCSYGEKCPRIDPSQPSTPSNLSMLWTMTIRRSEVYELTPIYHTYQVICLLGIIDSLYPNVRNYIF